MLKIPLDPPFPKGEIDEDLFQRGEKLFPAAYSEPVEEWNLSLS